MIFNKIFFMILHIENVVIFIILLTESNEKCQMPYLYLFLVNNHTC